MTIQKIVIQVGLDAIDAREQFRLTLVRWAEYSQFVLTQDVATNIYMDDEDLYWNLNLSVIEPVKCWESLKDVIAPFEKRYATISNKRILREKPEFSPTIIVQEGKNGWEDCKTLYNTGELAEVSIPRKKLH